VYSPNKPNETISNVEIQNHSFHSTDWWNISIESEMSKNREKQKLQHAAQTLQQNLKFGKKKVETNDLNIPIYQKYGYMYKRPKLDANIFESGIEDCI
jgi:hypothetical protein